MNHLSGRLEYRLCDSWQCGLAACCPQPVGGSTEATRACRLLVFSHPLKLWHCCLGRRVNGGADNSTVATCLRGLGSVVVILRGVERSTKDSTLVELPSSRCSRRVGYWQECNRAVNVDELPYFLLSKLNDTPL
ncbi:hypothetical protein PGTUg99_003388 [Puccinia graminis f. sp. tritici]|uniref:Uncharacterized protein n=1 Tax=Puccinia graminis f. sp. tritici TaxID=56615 RepID=A0A5B0NT12_PUCGR|nr:hypothetical protein PGTUg99_003388 [Puccinia graminis f. sp. tritici]